VVDDIGDIGQPQCHKCTKKQTKTCERERRKSLVTLWVANVTNNVTQVLPNVTQLLRHTQVHRTVEYRQVEYRQETWIHIVINKNSYIPVKWEFYYCAHEHVQTHTFLIFLSVTIFVIHS